MTSSINTLADVPEFAAAAFSTSAAITDGRVDHTFADIAAMCDLVSDSLVTMGVGKGDRVVLYGENHAHWICCYYGILQLGAVVVPVNKLLRGHEVAFIADDCGAAAVIASPAMMPELANAFPEPVSLLPWSAFFDREAGSAGRVERPELAPDDIASVCYTSGTTGTPKGATLTHRNILTNALMTASMHGKLASDVIYSALPCPHVYGNVVFQSAFLTGCKLYLNAAFDAGEALAAIRTHGVTVFEGVPTMYFYLLNEDFAAADCKTLRMLTVGGQTMPVAKMEEVQRRFDAPLVELWGMTELAGLGTTHCALAGQVGNLPLGSIGTALPGVEARVVSLDDPGKEAPSGEKGELQVRGPIVMQGYWNNAAATRQTIDDLGWLATGDIATKDASGHVRIVDRKKDMILTAGYNIYPAELEARLSEHPDVAMVAVASEADDEKGEIPVAHVVLRPKSDLGEEALREHCRARLAAYKVPRKFVFADDLPKTSSGKIMRRALRK
jgi:long-chain acyl-CoA synthetase